MNYYANMNKLQPPFQTLVGRYTIAIVNKIFFVILYSMTEVWNGCISCCLHDRTRGLTNAPVQTRTCSERQIPPDFRAECNFTACDI